MTISVRLFNLYASGRTYDEIAYIRPGYIFFSLAKKADFNNIYWWTKPDYPPLARYIYGIGAYFDFTTTDSHGQPEFNYDFTYSRLESVIFSSLSVLLVIFFGWEFISFSVGTLAGIILALLPFFLGFSQLATLESLIMFFYTGATYIYIKILKDYSFKKTILLGITIGLAVSIKPTNILLIPMFFLMFLVWHFTGKTHILSLKKNSLLKKKLRTFSYWGSLIRNPRCLAIIYAFAVAIVTFFAIWPMSLLHISYIISYTHQFRFGTNLSVPEIFFGKLHLTPVYYYVVLFLITTPVLLLLFFIIGLFKVKSIQKWTYYCVALWFFFPFVQSFYHFRQEGIRYIIEMYAPFSLLVAVGFYAVMERLSVKTKYIVSFCIVFLIVYLISIDLRVSPYYIDYYNELVGGPAGVYHTRISQLGWWGEGTKEAVDYVNTTAAKNSKVAIVGNQLAVAPPIQKILLTTYDKKIKYDYIILNYYTISREGYNDSEIKKNYILIHTVTVDQAPLVFIYRKK